MTDEQLKYLMMLKEFNSELMELNIKYSEEIERLNNIIKEVREYINENEDYFYNYPLVNREHLLEILGSEKSE